MSDPMMQKRIRVTFLGFTSMADGTISVRLNNGKIGTFKRSPVLGQMTELTSYITRDRGGKCNLPEMSVTLLDGEYIAFTLVVGRTVVIPENILNSWRLKALENGALQV